MPPAPRNQFVLVCQPHNPPPCDYVFIELFSNSSMTSWRSPKNIDGGFHNHEIWVNCVTFLTELVVVIQFCVFTLKRQVACSLQIVWCILWNSFGLCKRYYCRFYHVYIVKYFLGSVLVLHDLHLPIFGGHLRNCVLKLIISPPVASLCYWT